MTNKQKYKLVRKSITQVYIPKLLDELVKGGGGTTTEIYYKAPKKVKFETLVDCDNDFFNGTGKITIYGAVSNFSLGKWTEGSSSGTGTSALDDECELSDITELIIPEGVIKTLENVLPENSNVEIIDLPDSLTEIGDESFKMLYNLRDIKISNNVVSIGAEAFAMGTPDHDESQSATIGNSALINIDVPESVTEIGENAFFGIDNVNYNGSATGAPWGALEVNAYVEKPIIYEDNTKTHILKSNLNKANTTDIIEIPNSVITIDENAFSFNPDSGSSAAIGKSILETGIVEINIPDSVESIGNNAFCNIPNINYNGPAGDSSEKWGAFYRNATVDLPYVFDDAEKTVGLKMVYECIDDELVTLSSSLTAINKAFTDTNYTITDSINNKKLFQITIPNNIYMDEGYSYFQGIPNVVYNGDTSNIASTWINKYVEDGIVYEDSTKTFGLQYLRSDKITFTDITSVNYDFAKLNNFLTVISMPNCVNVGNNAFYNCISLTSVDLPSCTYMSGSVFGGDILLTSAYLPSCTYIEQYAFSGCRSLTYVNLSNCTYVGQSAFTSCTTLTSINLPSVTFIGSNVFDSCSLLSNININSVSYIDSMAFQKCGLTCIDLPNITYICMMAFQSCQSLEYAVFDRITPPTIESSGGGIFNGCYSLTAIFVPDTCVNTYKSNQYWSMYSYLITGISTM